MVRMMKVMMHRDARTLSHATLEEMRRLAVKSVLEGESQKDLAARLQVHPGTVCKWVAMYRAEGDAALASSKAAGPQPKLEPKQVDSVRKIIVGKNPRQLNFGPALWTLDLVGQLIKNKFGIVLHNTTIGRMLHRLGVTPQKPLRRAFQRDGEECRLWMQVEFPKIVAEAKRKQATLLFLDETGVHENHAVGTTWGERGNRPIVTASGSRRRVNAISAISPRGRLWFRCYQGNLNAPLYIEFLEALMSDVRGKIIVVHDKHPAHTAAATQRYLLSRAARINTHFLPSYAPDLNPDEHVWSYLKGTFRSAPLEKEDSLHDRVEASLDVIASDNKLVQSFFGHPAVSYVREALHW
jgi:transposase